MAASMAVEMALWWVDKLDVLKERQSVVMTAAWMGFLKVLLLAGTMVVMKAVMMVFQVVAAMVEKRAG